MRDFKQRRQLTGALFHALFQQLLRLDLFGDVTIYCQHMRLACIGEWCSTYLYIEYRPVFPSTGIPRLKLAACFDNFKCINENMLSFVIFYESCGMARHLFTSVAIHLTRCRIHLDHLAIFQVDDM